MPRRDDERRIERTLLIDADDTLWENNVFYLRCTADFLDYMASLGYDPDAVSGMLDVCERETISALGYGPGGFVAALGLTCERLLRESGREPAPGLVARARYLGQLMLSPPMIVLPDVEPTLVALRPSTHLVLVTKGDQETQQGKIERSGLGPLFDARYVVGEKNAETYRRIASELVLNPRTTWMVGNSPKSDINPAIQAGLGAILIPHDHTWPAELQEIADPLQVVKLERFPDLLPFFGVERGPFVGGAPSTIGPTQA